MGVNKRHANIAGVSFPPPWDNVRYHGHYGHDKSLKRRLPPRRKDTCLSCLLIRAALMVNFELVVANDESTRDFEPICALTYKLSTV